MANQEILLKRSTNVYASEDLAWDALNKATHIKGQPMVAFYSSSGGNGDTTTGIILVVGTQNGTGTYKAVASHDDFLALDTRIDVFEDMFEFRTDSKGNTYIATKYDFASDKEISAGGIGDGEGSGTTLGTLGGLSNVKENVDTAATGSLLAFDGTHWYAIAQSAITPDLTGYAKTTEVNEAIATAKSELEGKINDVSTDVSGLSTWKSTAEGQISALEGTVGGHTTQINDVSGKVNTLIGNDTGKSVRDISKLAVADLLQGADADFDTLLEIANYLETHSSDAIEMSNSIEALKKITKTFYGDGTSVTEDSIKTYIDAAKQAALDAVTALQTGDVATAKDNIATLQTSVAALQAITITAGAGLTGGGNLSANRTINVVSANDGITVNTDNIQLNAVDNLTSTSTTKPLSANQGKVLQANITAVAGRSVTAGNGLTGGGTLTGDVTLDVNVDGTSIVITSDKLEVSKIDGGTF